MSETLGQRIARLRASAGLTQRQLAERAGLPLGTVRNWEQDIREPLASAVVKLAQALGVTSSEILGEASAAPPATEEQPKRPPGRPRKAEAEPPAEPPAKSEGEGKGKGKKRK